MAMTDTRTVRCDLDILAVREELTETVEFLQAIERASAGGVTPVLTPDDLYAVVQHIRLRVSGALDQLPIS